MRTPTLIATVLAGALSLGAIAPAQAGDADIDCKLHYSLTGWSVIYKHTTGSGTLRRRLGLACRAGTRWGGRALASPNNHGHCDAALGLASLDPTYFRYLSNHAIESLTDCTCTASGVYTPLSLRAT